MSSSASRRAKLPAPEFPSASPTLVSRTRTAALSVARFSSDVRDGGMLEVDMPTEDAVVALFQLRAHASHQIFLDGRWHVTPAIPRGSLHFVDLRDEPRAYLREAVDTLMFHMPREVLDELAEDVGAPRIGGLEVPEPWRTPDPVLDKLQHLIAEGIASHDGTDNLLYDHLMLGIAGHFATTYGDLRPRAELLRGGLAPWQARRATELLADNLSKDMSLKDVAHGHAGVLDENPVQMALVGKAAGVSQLGERRLRGAQRIFGSLDPKRLPPIVRGSAEGCFESASEIGK